MSETFDTYRPAGFRTVNSYLFVSDPETYITFLQSVFEAIEIHRTLNPENGDLSNVILKVGDTCVMISQAREPFLNMYTALYLYVNDVDTLHSKAIANGASEVFAPADMDYGDRQSGIKDPCGNYWWISKRLLERGYHEK